MKAESWLALAKVGVVSAFVVSLIVGVIFGVWAAIMAFFAVWYMFLGPHAYLTYLQKEGRPLVKRVMGG